MCTDALIAEMYKICLSVDDATQGEDNEDTACSDYSGQQIEGHTEFSYTAVGLVVNPKYPRLGAMPDGWVVTAVGEGLLR